MPLLWQMSNISHCNRSRRITDPTAQTVEKAMHPRKLSNSTKSWFITVIITIINVFLIS